MKRQIGYCRMCGIHGPLSWEHVPPEAAFNDKTVWNARVAEIFGAENFESFIDPRSDQNQRGAGGYTLCEKCNNDTGAWYAPSFISWSHQGMEYLRKANGAPAVSVPFHILPLKVFKQIIVMFFSACQEGMYDKEPDLVRFVKNRENRLFPHKFRLFGYYNDPARSIAARQAGWTALLELGSENRTFAEISFPPFGFILSLDSPPVDKRLVDITYFATFGFQDYEVMHLKFPALPVCSPYPGDFRSLEELKVNFDARRPPSLVGNNT